MPLFLFYVVKEDPKGRVFRTLQNVPTRKTLTIYNMPWDQLLKFGSLGKLKFIAEIRSRKSDQCGPHTIRHICLSNIETNI